MAYQFTANNGGRNECYRFFEDLMLCVKDQGIHRQMYKCAETREDYHECVNNEKKRVKLLLIKQQRQKLMREGKWPPKE